METSPRGFALLISVILTSVSLAVGLALLDIAYKQVLLATTAKQSEVAFYHADSTIECALYYDQSAANAFDVFSPAPSTNIVCNSAAISSYTSVLTNGGNTRTTKFDIPCTSGGVSGTATIIKDSISNTTAIFASGYSTCNAADPARVERGEKINY
jgi:hypothetical protein